MRPRYRAARTRPCELSSPYDGGLMADDVLSARAMALYERLITATALPLVGGDLDPDDTAVHELLESGFAKVTPGEPRQLLPVAPVEAFERVLTRLQAQFSARQRELADAYSYLDGLQQRFLDSQPTSDADALADIRADDGAYPKLTGELARGARSEVLCWNLALQDLLVAHRPASTGGSGRAGDASAASADFRARTVYDTAFLQREGGSAVLRRARAAGEELRIADELPSSMLIVDTSAVVLPLSGGAAGALLIRSELVVNAMREFFELMWQRCVPWVDREADGEILTPVQRQIVALMAVGHSDEEIAGHLGVSLRTVRRHVSDVMERLHAGTRFAAGIAAAQAGLLEDADLSDTDVRHTDRRHTNDGRANDRHTNAGHTSDRGGAND